MSSADMEPDGISQEPVSILFSPASVAKKDVWDIDLVQILDLLVGMLEKRGGKDLKVAGMAALSSSFIYRLKVESIFALQKAAMEKKPVHQRKDIDIRLIDIPYRHESRYPVSLEDMLELLQNLITTLANPKHSRRGLRVEPDAPQDPGKFLISFDDMVSKYGNLIMRKIPEGGSGLLRDVVAELDELDSIRCFIASLFLAKDEKVDLAQEGEEIRITRIGGAISGQN